MDVREKLINANELLNSIRDDYNINGANFAKIRRHIEAAPAVEAVEVVHGRWEVSEFGYLVCTNCGWIRYGIPLFEYYPHCPNCGAKMEGGAD